MLRVGIIGCGNVSIVRHIPALNSLENASVVAVADPIRSRSEEARSIAGLTESQVFNSPKRMFQNYELDYAVVAVPPAERTPALEEALMSGIDLLIEKPLSTRPSEAAHFVELAKGAGVKLGMAHNYLYFPEYVLVREMIDRGQIGTVRHLGMNFLGVPDYPGHPEYRPRWRHDPEQAGGGVLMDMIHVMYLAEFLMGQKIEAVGAVVDNLDHPNEQVEDLALLHLHFSDGYASVNVGWGHGPGGIEITGSAGRLLGFYADYSTGPFAPMDELVLVNEEGTTRQHVTHSSEVILDTFVEVHNDFIAAIVDQRPPAATGGDGSRILQTAMAAYKSGLTGRVIGLPLEPADPVYTDGVVGLRAEERNAWGAKALFGLSRAEDVKT